MFSFRIKLRELFASSDWGRGEGKNNSENFIAFSILNVEKKEEEEETLRESSTLT